MRCNRQKQAAGFAVEALSVAPPVVACGGAQFGQIAGAVIGHRMSFEQAHGYTQVPSAAPRGKVQYLRKANALNAEIRATGRRLILRN